MVQRAATHIAKKAVEMDIVPGRSPISVAAAAIYMASQVITFRLKFFFTLVLTASHLGFGTQKKSKGNRRYCRSG